MQPPLACTGCGSSCGILTTASGNFSDGSGPNNYQINANCKWIIAPLGAAQITATFTVFGLERNFDFVRVYQCNQISCETGELIASLSGTYATAQTVTSTTGFMFVRFSSDEDVVSQGFMASWNSSTQPWLPPQQQQVSRVFICYVCVRLVI